MTIKGLLRYFSKLVKRKVLKSSSNKKKAEAEFLEVPCAINMSCFFG